jgi:hypothetical protein
MAVTYNTMIQQLADLLVPSAMVNNTGTIVDPDLAIEMPAAIDYAENRIYQELDFLQTRQAQTLSFSPNNRNLSFAGVPNPIMVLEEVAAVTPPGTAPDLGTRNTLIPVSKPFLDAVYNSVSGAGVPIYFAPVDAQSIIVGPFPDQGYAAELTGTVRPAPISFTNQTTWLSTYYSALLISACMIHLCGWRKDYGAANSDDPRAAGYWEAQFTKLAGSAAVEDARRRQSSASWTSQKPLPSSTPPRR